MTTTIKVLFEATPADSTQQTLYTAQAKTTVDKMTAYNSSASPVTVKVNLVAPEGAIGASNVVTVKTIAAGQTWMAPELVGQVLETGGVVSVLASAGGVVIIRGSGREFT